MTRLATALLCGLLLAGCRSMPTPELTATGTAQRVDEGTALLTIAIRNHEDHDVAVQQVRLDMGELSGPPVEVNRAIRPGDAVALKVEHLPDVCTHTTAEPRLSITWSDGVTEIPLDLRPDSLPEQIRKRACDLAELKANASVSLETGRIQGRSYRSAIVLERVPGSSGRVEVVDVGGSVLLRLKADLPAVLTQERLRVPLTIAPTPRCDPHAQSQSSQTFLLSAYLTVGDRDVRAVLPLSPDVQTELQGLISRYCAR